MPRFLSLTSALFFLFVVHTAAAQSDDLSPAPIVNDEGGAVVITGQLSYTNPFFTSGVAYPLIILEDQAGFVDRDKDFLFPPESQTLGQFTSDFFRSPVSYSLALPLEPQGTLRDVDNDAEVDAGVMVFAVAYWNNVWGDPFLEERDQQGGGWSTAYASTRTSSNPDTLREIVGGQLIVYAPDDAQGFPSGFGADGLLFTEDDPVLRLPQGYTLVDMDSDPFTFDRSRRPVLNLYEPEVAALVDFSDLSYTDAFDSMIDKLKKEYAFTEYKGIDWDSLALKYRTFFEEADAENDAELYLATLSELLWSIPDGHVAVSPLSQFGSLQDVYPNSLGFAIRETDSGEVFVVFVAPDSPAQRAGISVGTQITAINGRTISDHISRTDTWAQTTSTPHNRRLAQLRYATRFGPDVQSVDVRFIDTTGTEVTRSIRTLFEFQSFVFDPNDDSTRFDLPVEYRQLESGFLYASITTFFDNDALTIQLWERMIRELQQENLRGLIIDMRYNGGGSGFLADQMSAYFFNEPLVVGKRGAYNEEIDDFFFDPDFDLRMYLPEPELRYDGPVAVLVGPDCASACERFSYNMTLQDRAQIIGQYPTAGLGGSVDDFNMPEGVTVRFTAGRSVNVNGEIHIEGIGVAPTLRVPVTEETLFADGDPVLETAVAYLDERTQIEFVEGGSISVGSRISDRIEANTRVYYFLSSPNATSVDILLENNADDVPLTLAVFNASNGAFISSSSMDDAEELDAALRGLTLAVGEALIVEVSTQGDRFAGDYVLAVEEVAD